MKRSLGLRYLWLAGAPRSYLLVVFGALAAFGVCLEFLEPGSSESAVVGILLVQLFAASTGFSGRASRGFYDPVLTSGVSRAEVAFLHFAVSAGPGAAAWLVVGLAQALRAGSVHVGALRPAGLVGLLLVSSVSWASTLSLPAFSGGGAWLVVSIGLLLSGSGMKWFGLFRGDPEYLATHPWQGTLFGLSFPLFIGGLRWPAGPLAALAAGSLAALAGGVLFVLRADFALAEDE